MLQSPLSSFQEGHQECRIAARGVFQEKRFESPGGLQTVPHRRVGVGFEIRGEPLGARDLETPVDPRTPIGIPPRNVAAEIQVIEQRAAAFGLIQRLQTTSGNRTWLDSQSSIPPQAR
jgi:hypothetical protein